MYKYLFVLFSFLMLLNSCDSHSEKDKLKEAIKNEELNLVSKTTTFKWDEKKASHLIASYQQFVKSYPEDSIAPEYLFKSAEMLIASKKYMEANKIYEQIVGHYPNYKKTPTSLFSEGFNYENNLQDLQNARKYYELFLQKYPSHPLADDVRISLQNLGKSADEIVKEFEKKNAIPK